MDPIVTHTDGTNAFAHRVDACPQKNQLCVWYVGTKLRAVSNRLTSLYLFPHKIAFQSTRKPINIVNHVSGRRRSFRDQSVPVGSQNQKRIDRFRLECGHDRQMGLSLPLVNL